MTSLATVPQIIGFFSYSREDDEDSDGALSKIRLRIQSELRGLLGRSRESLRLWQDREAIPPGSLWESQIDAAIQQSTFFIPIITPRVIYSKYCGIELDKFVDRERQLSRSDLVFPILYIDVAELENEQIWRQHPVLKTIGERQYVDWREFRLDPDSLGARRAIASYCAKVAAALKRSFEMTQAEDHNATIRSESTARAPVDEPARAARDTERVKALRADPQVPPRTSVGMPATPDGRPMPFLPAASQSVPLRHGIGAGKPPRINQRVLELVVPPLLVLESLFLFLGIHAADVMRGHLWSFSDYLQPGVPSMLMVAAAVIVILRRKYYRLLSAVIFATLLVVDLLLVIFFFVQEPDFISWGVGEKPGEFAFLSGIPIFVFALWVFRFRATPPARENL